MVDVAWCRFREKSCLRSDGQTVEFFLCGLYPRERGGRGRRRRETVEEREGGRERKRVRK
jgi:hypothetical protein